MYELRCARVCASDAAVASAARVAAARAAARAASPCEARAIALRAPASSRRMSSPWPATRFRLSRFVIASSRLVEPSTISSGSTLSLLVEHAEPLRDARLRDARASLRNCELMTQAPRARARSDCACARSDASLDCAAANCGRANRARARPRAISPRSQHLAHATTQWSATDSRRLPTVRSAPPRRSRRTETSAVAACVPALARGRTVPQSRSRTTATSCRNEQVSRKFAAVPR